MKTREKQRSSWRVGAPSGGLWGLRGRSALLFAALLAGCVAGDEANERARQAATTCPEAVRLNDRGEPIGLVSGHVRWCWPGEPACYCDRDNDCYRLDGYVACVPPSADAGADAASDGSDAVADATDAAPDGSDAVADATDAAPDGSDAGADATDATPDGSDAVADVTDATPDGSDAVADVTDATVDAADVAIDVADAADAPIDAVNYCPEPVRLSSRGEPIGVLSGQVRWCWPGEAHCYCDSWGDCYALSGYVPCTPPPSIDAGTTSDGGFEAGVPSDAPPPPTDPVAYTGTLSTTSGQTLSTLTVAGLTRYVWAYIPARRSTRPPLVIAYHGTDQWGDQILAGMDAKTFADAYGVIVLAPEAIYQDAAHADFNRPLGDARYWTTAYDTNPDTNPDLLLTRALIKEAARTLSIDTDRVYAAGFSNGGFMALTAAVVLRERFAGFTESSAGLVQCATRASCAFRGTALSCASLATQSGWCACAGPERPIALPATGGRPGFLWHAAGDGTVSVYYSCKLDARMSALGIPHRIEIWTGDHYATSSWMQRAWPYLSGFVR